MVSLKRQLAFVVTFATLFLVIMCASVLAETADSPGSRGPAVMKRGKGAQSGPDYRLNMMTSKLALSEEQRTKIKPILDEELAQLEALRGNDSLNRDERRSKLQQLNKETSEKIRPFLTVEQQKSQDNVKQKISNNRSKERNTRPGPNPGENTPDNRLLRLTKDLSLTKEQQAKIKPILLEEYTQLEAMRGNDSLNRDQRREKLLALNKATSENIKSQITEEQQKKYDAIRQKIEDRRTQTKIPNSGKPK
jgi:Spy/CpxP family protein refolding chaperone